MQLVKKGKTKDLYALSDGNYMLKFKDDVTGTDGKFDPGANTVGLSIEGMGRAGLAMSCHFFEIIKKTGIPTHFVSADLDNNAMVVKPAHPFGNGLEVICRLRAVGSFLRRYGEYTQEGAKLDCLVEMTLKDDDRGDPLIVPEALEQLGILTQAEYAELSRLSKMITKCIAEEIAAKGLELYDIKFEFGRHGDQLLLIDEISAGNMRVYSPNGVLEPLELAGIFNG